MKLTVQLALISAVNIGLAFFSQWYVLTRLGPGAETDALFAGMTVPQLVLAVISGSLMHVLVPLLAGENEDRLRHDSWCFFVLVGGLFSILAVLFYIAAPWWVPLVVPGFSRSGQALTVMLTRIQLVGMVFTAFNGVQWAAYHARQRFLWAEITPILASGFSLLLLVWALPRFGVIAAAWISTLRIALQTLLLSPGMGCPVRLDLSTPAIRQAWGRIKPLLLGSAYYKTDPLVDRFLLSTASSGSLSLYYLAQQIYGAATQILNKAVAAPLVPVLSMLHKAEDREGFRRVYHRKLLHLGGVSLAGTIVLVFWGQGVLSLLIGRGRVSVENVKELWWIMVCLSGMFLGSVLGQISSSSFFARGDTSTPTKLGIYSYSAYVPVKICLYYYFGALGLAVATSLFLVVNLGLQHYLLTINYFDPRYKEVLCDDK